MIRLTTITKVLTEAAEKKLDELQNQYMTGEQDPHEEDMWSRLGIPRPEGEDDSFDEPGGITFEDSDFENVEGYALVKPSRIDLILQKEEGSEVFLESGKSFTAKETPEEIEQLIGVRGVN